MPKRIQLRRTKGYRKPPDAVTVRRPTPWGNPFAIKDYGRAEALRLFAQWLTALPAAERDRLLAPLRGKDLACVCPLAEPCHGDIWLRWANQIPAAAWLCPACGAWGHGPTRDDLEPAAWHEAGHTLMRWLRLPDTVGTTCMHPDGSGYSDTALPGAVIRTEDTLLILLAGAVAEVGMLGTPLDLARSHSEDLTAAYALLTPAYLAGWLGGRYTPQGAVHYYWQWAHKELWHAIEALEALAEQLGRWSVLTAEDIRAICRCY